MKVLYISSPSFFDMDLSLIKRMNNTTDFYYLLDLPKYALNSTALSIENQLDNCDILSINNYREFDKFYDFLNPKKSFVINRTTSKFYSIKNLSLQLKILRFVNKINPDIIHCNNDLNLNFLSVLLNFKFKKVVTIHDPFVHFGEGSFRDSLNRWMSIKLIKNFILLNNFQINDFIIKNKISAQSVHLSSLGIYEYINLFKRQNIVCDKNIILFFGRISPYKGIEYLLKAYDGISSFFPYTQLVIAGSGEYYFDISSYKKNPNIIFMNHFIDNETLNALLHKSLFVVCPYIDATQSGVIMTSYALSVPVLATNVGALQEAVENDKTGIIINPKSESEISEKIIYLLKNNEKLNEFKKNIETAFIEGEKNWETISKKLVNVYKKIIFDK